MTNEFYKKCREEDKNWIGVHSSMLTQVTDVVLLKQLYEQRLQELKWRIEEYEKNIQP
jgi:hypothetical protein